MTDANNGVMPENRPSCKARRFAEEARRDQLYNGKPYVAEHVSSVVAVLTDLGFGEPYISAAWLHDTIEDTLVTYHDICDEFGISVANIVYACTGVGRNRRERNGCITDRVSRFPLAAIVKVADRIANLEASEADSSHRKMYVKERFSFDDVACLAPLLLQHRLRKAYEMT